MPRGDEDGQLVQPLRQRRLETGGGAELLREVADLRAPQQNIERTVGAAPRPRQEMLEHRLLRWRQLIVGERPESVATQTDAARIGALGRRRLSIGDSDESERADARDHKASHVGSPFRRLYYAL